jgi:hypothetical protein
MVVLRRKENVYTTAGVTFYPGLNALTEEQEKRVSDNAGFKEQCDPRAFIDGIPNMSIIQQAGADEQEVGSGIVDDDSGDRATDSAATIAALSSKDALQVVNGSNDVDVLIKVRDNDKRATVKKAAGARVEILNNGGEKE